MFDKIYAIDGSARLGSEERGAVGEIGVYSTGHVLGGLSYISGSVISGLSNPIHKIKGRITSFDGSTMTIKTEKGSIRFSGVSEGDINEYRSRCTAKMN